MNNTPRTQVLRVLHLTRVCLEIEATSAKYANSARERMAEIDAAAALIMKYWNETPEPEPARNEYR